MWQHVVVKYIILIAWDSLKTLFWKPGVLFIIIIIIIIALLTLNWCCKTPKFLLYSHPWNNHLVQRAGIDTGVINSLHNMSEGNCRASSSYSPPASVFNVLELNEWMMVLIKWLYFQYYHKNNAVKHVSTRPIGGFCFESCEIARLKDIVCLRRFGRWLSSNSRLHGRGVTIQVLQSLPSSAIFGTRHNSFNNYTQPVVYEIW